MGDLQKERERERFGGEPPFVLKKKTKIAFFTRLSVRDHINNVFAVSVSVENLYMLEIVYSELKGISNKFENCSVCQ